MPRRIASASASHQVNGASFKDDAYESLTGVVQELPTRVVGHEVNECSRVKGR